MAESYFNSARENLNHIHNIEVDELIKFTNLIEKSIKINIRIST